MNREMEFRVLGKLEVMARGRRIKIPRGNQRSLLASLVLNANKDVPVDDLVEYLWCERTPRRPRSALHTCVTRLRNTFDAYGVSLCDTLHTTSVGYMLEADPASVDLLRFRAFIVKAEAAADQGDTMSEFTWLAKALSQWRGPALLDVQSDLLHRDLVPRLTEECGNALERRFEIAISLGRHGDVVGELRTLTHRHRFREGFWRLLMTALYRSGRQAEALEAYGEISAQLNDELGIDPSHELQDLRMTILRNETV
ncbi:AfsR/SARP family transcriptional regulator [Actinomadura rudentiformis]|uniref:AfsR/SARP family transcriptional regulator n=1 Tax=Actinomadura rudentiformis TaxID=359158 RepID=A0A6H9ZD31_9ACTN|nr:AfsR/SARP family transcriptional regulator [Actinomadura rudentiformis]KAB2352449.1 AfsR/SARP family transcriptional regulator [Actinomadura rudentiformis]